MKLKIIFQFTMLKLQSILLNIAVLAIALVVFPIAICSNDLFAKYCETIIRKNVD